MSNRIAKQLIYGTFYLVVWGVVIGGIYFIFIHKPPVSPPAIACSVDCLPIGAVPLSVDGPLRYFATDPQHATFLARILNTNVNYAARQFDYAITFYDAENATSGSLVGQSFIYSGEEKFVIIPNQPLATTFDHAAVEVKNVHWVPADAMGAAPQFSFRNLASSRSGATVSVSGKILNQDVVILKHVLIVAVFRGVDGQPIGASQTEVDDLSPEQPTDFSIIYPAVTGLDPSNDQVFAYAVKG